MKFGNLGDYSFNRDASENGTPIDLGQGRVLFVRQAGGFNRRFDHLVATRAGERALFEISDPIEQRLEWDRLNIEVAAEALIAGWEGIEDADGQAVEFSVAAALELLSQHPRLAELVLSEAYKEENFRNAEECKSALRNGAVG
ncbi:MAG: hypothetical protein CMQ40_12750 [Gammaproteobacteria bacterium]|nr:hypothetical protein [Gammaproteobacteria bacterium]|tara:strand:+ start:2888 stop:3316 length:429 start_codon:yes stop_codon:yes gene_type:complete